MTWINQPKHFFPFFELLRFFQQERRDFVQALKEPLLRVAG
jgi:hypothetical protein